MQGNEKSADKTSEEELVSGTSIRIQKDCLDRPSMTLIKADYCSSL